MAIQEMERLGNPLSILSIFHANDTWQPTTHMHMPCILKLVKETYMQLDTWEQIWCNCCSQCLFAFSCSSFTFLLQESKYATPSKSNPRKLQVSKSMRELQNWIDKRLPTDPHKLFYEWGFYFFHFPLFSLNFLLTWNLWPFTSLFS